MPTIQQLVRKGSREIVELSREMYAKWEQQKG